MKESNQKRNRGDNFPNVLKLLRIVELIFLFMVVSVFSVFSSEIRELSVEFENLNVKNFVDKNLINGTSGTILQNITVSGKVTDNRQQPLPGVTVVVKDTSHGTTTNANGDYTLNNVPENGTLVFSFVGMHSQEVLIGNQTIVNVIMEEETIGIDEVVVTALGISREEKSLVYSTQVMKGNDLTAVKSDNLMNTLNGKVAGVSISPSASGVGGSVKVVMRGSKNINGNNQPLYVIDGVPISNVSNAQGQPSTPWTTRGGVDGGDGISNLNPEDIESINVLQGAAGSALYGSQAANGVVLITTKKGKAGTSKIDFSVSYTNQGIAYEPNFQNTYGQTPNAVTSWGAKLTTPAKNNLSEYFKNGHNTTTSISLSSGSNIAQTYFSYANTSSTGIQPNNKLVRNNFTFRETGRFLNDRLTVDVNTNYIQQRIDNTPGIGFFLNPLTGLYLFPAGKDITEYKNQYEIPDPERNFLPTQNWLTPEVHQQNPWWILNKIPNYSTRNRLIMNGSVKYDFTNWLYLQVRGNIDRTSDDFQRNLHAGTNPVNVQGPNGSFIRSEQTFTQKYADAITGLNIPVSTLFKLNGIFGISIKDDINKGTNFDMGLGLNIPNVFIAQNILTSTTSNASTLSEGHNQIQSIFGNLNLSYNNWLFLDLTGRNDWSSSLAFTNNVSYFYPSAGLSILLDQVLKLPKFINLVKVRGSYTEVASSVPTYRTNPLNSIAAGGGVSFNLVQPNPELKPTNTKSVEGGIDLRLFDNRVNFNVNFYKSNTYNQFLQYVPPASSGYTVGYLNAGNIQNKGIEILLSYDIIKSKKMNWNTAINYSKNKNEVIELNPNDPEGVLVISSSSGNAYESAIQKGGSWGDIYAVKFERNENGQILLSDKGQPINNNKFEKVGNSNPKWQLGWDNTLDYKNFTLSFLIDGKFGGQVMSMTQMLLDGYGVSKESGDARDIGGVKVNAVDPHGTVVSTIDPYLWYSTVGGRSGIGEAYMYDATVVKLRQVILGYNFPIVNNFIKEFRLSLIGSNLFYFIKKAPYDPEITMSTGNYLNGVDAFNLPATRNVGIQFNVSF